MKKTYRLTIEFSSRINGEKIMGIGDMETVDRTRQCIQALLKDDRVLLDLYRLKLYNEYLFYFENSGVFKRRLGIKDTADIMKAAACGLPPEVAAYIEGLYGSAEPLDRVEFEEWQRKKVLLENQFGELKVGKVTFEEVKGKG
jgi:hypothetical protein